MFEAGDIKSIVSALTGGSTIALIGLVKWILQNKAKNKNRAKYSNFENGIKRITSVYNNLNTILNGTEAHRVLILRAENSGKVPEVGKELYSSIIHEVFDGEIGTAYQKWRKQPVDAAYLQLLLDVSQKGHVVLDKQHVKSAALLGLWESDGVQRAYVYKIYSEPEKFFYMSINFGYDTELSLKDHDLIRSARNNIRSAFESQSKLRAKK